jgi:hypothetical protein
MGSWLWSRRKRDDHDLEVIGADWGDSLRVFADPNEPGAVFIEVSTDGEHWSSVEVGTGDVEDIVALLRGARDEARRFLRVDLESNLAEYIAEKERRRERQQRERRPDA